MLNVEAGTNHTFRLDLRDTGGTLPADPNTLSYLVRDTAGTILIPETAVANLAGANTVEVPTLATLNTIPNGQLFRVLFVMIKWQSGAKLHSRSKPYRVVPFIPSTTTVDDIRAVFGLTEDDLEDEAADIPGTYLNLVSELGDTFSSALISGTATQLAANRCILFTEALRLIPGFRLRVIASNQDGALKVDRLKTIDFDAIERAARAGLEEAKAALSASGNTAGYTILSLTTPTDPVTGA